MRELLLRHQLKSLNEGWRIRFISHEPDDRPMTFGYGNNWPGRLAGVSGGVSLLAAVAALALGIYANAGEEGVRVEELFRMAVFIFLAALVMAVASMLLARLVFTASLARTRATCIDREFRSTPHPEYNRDSWAVRIVCRYAFEGVQQTGTPHLAIGAEQGMDFASREAAEQFLADRISPDGTCWLRVDPRKPLRAYLM